MKLNIVYRQMTLRGEFRGVPFEVDYSSDDGWNAGNGIVCRDPDFEGADGQEYDTWRDELHDYLWDNTQDLLAAAQ